MFKKLKQKISEEQLAPAAATRSPGGRGPGLLQGASASSPSTSRSRTSSLEEQNDEGTLTPNREPSSGGEDATEKGTFRTDQCVHA